MDYCTIAAVREYLDITTGGDDILLGDLITASSRWLNRETRRLLVTDTDTTVYIDAVGDHIERATLHVSDFGDLSSITSVTNGDSVVVASSEYTTYPKVLTVEKPTYKRIKLLSSSGRAWAYTNDYENSIEIVGKWALFADTVPYDVAQNCKLLTAFSYRQKDPGIFETIVIPAEGVAQVPRGFPTSVSYWVRRMRKP